MHKMWAVRERGVLRMIFRCSPYKLGSVTGLGNLEIDRLKQERSQVWFWMF